MKRLSNKQLEVISRMIHPALNKWNFTWSLWSDDERIQTYVFKMKYTDYSWVIKVDGGEIVLFRMYIRDEIVDRAPRYTTIRK